MIAAAEAGPQPINNKLLNETNLTEAIKVCLSPQALMAAADIAQRMKTETGVDTALESFHNNLPVEDMTCDLLPEEPAVWSYKRSGVNLKLSDKAAQILVEREEIEAKYLKL